MIYFLLFLFPTIYILVRVSVWLDCIINFASFNFWFKPYSTVSHFHSMVASIRGLVVFVRPIYIVTRCGSVATQVYSSHSVAGSFSFLFRYKVDAAVCLRIGCVAVWCIFVNILSIIFLLSQMYSQVIGTGLACYFPLHLDKGS